MSAAPTLLRALLVPVAVTLALTALLLRPTSVAPPSVRPPLPTPIVLDELVAPAAVVQVAEPSPTAHTKEGLRSLRAH